MHSICKPANPFTPKMPWQLWWYLLRKRRIEKIFEKEMSIITVHTFSLQIYFRIIINSLIIIKSIKYADELFRSWSYMPYYSLSCTRNSEAWSSHRKGGKIRINRSARSYNLVFIFHIFTPWFTSHVYRRRREASFWRVKNSKRRWNRYKQFAIFQNFMYIKIEKGLTRRILGIYI